MEGSQLSKGSVVRPIDFHMFIQSVIQYQAVRQCQSMRLHWMACVHINHMSVIRIYQKQHEQVRSDAHMQETSLSGSHVLTYLRHSNSHQSRDRESTKRAPWTCLWHRERVEVRSNLGNVP
jgi:hypothetical protein